MFIQLQTLLLILFTIGLLNLAAICRKGPERRSGDQKKNRQKKNRNGVPVRSGSKRTLAFHLWPTIICRSAVPAPKYLPERRSTAFPHHYTPDTDRQTCTSQYSAAL